MAELSRVLVVDDEQSMRELLGIMLRRETARIYRSGPPAVTAANP